MADLTTDQRLQVSAAITTLIETGYFDRDACTIIARAVPHQARAPWLSLRSRGDGHDSDTVAAGVGRVRLDDERERTIQTRSTEVAAGQYRLSRSGRRIFVRDFMHASDPEPKPHLELVVCRQGEPRALYHCTPKTISFRLPLFGRSAIIAFVVFKRQQMSEKPQK